MARGGDTPSVGSDDIVGDEGRKKRGLDFLNAVRNTANDAILKQEAEDQFSAYGAPQVGAFEDGGIHQEQIDPENFYHHLNLYGQEAQGVFQNNQNIQNDTLKKQFGQYGGFTDPNSGLYKFIGGGDNELMDEQYQDSDLDYNQYARDGGSLNQYVDKGEVKETYLYSPIDGHKYTPEELAANKEEDEDVSTDETSKYIADTKQRQELLHKRMQEQLFNQNMSQLGNYNNFNGFGNFGSNLFLSPITRGIRYNQAVSDPYYTQSGEKYAGPDLANRMPTSTDVTKYGMFGKTKQFRVNYGEGSPKKISSFKVPTYTPGQSNVNNTSMGDSSDEPYRGKTFGERLGRGMVNSKIPGIQQLGAKLIPSGIGYEGSNVTDESETNNLINRFREKHPKFNDFGQGDSNASNVNPINPIAPSINPAVSSAVPTVNEPYYPPMSSRAQRRESRDDVKLNKFLTSNNNIDVFNDPKEIARMQKRDPGFQSLSNSTPSETILSPSQNQINQADENQMLYENALKNRRREYGGPVDYTEYAYGGDVSISELYKAQTGFETNTDGCPWGSTKDYKGDCVDGQGNVTKKRNTDFKMAEPNDLLEKPFSQPYKNPLTDETSAVRMGSDGNYVNEGIKYGDQEGDQEGVSQDFKNKQAWNINGTGLMNSVNFGANALSQGLENINSNKQQNQMYANIVPQEIKNAYNVGDYETDSGDFRPNDQGSKKSKYGGGIYAMGGNFADDDEDAQWMTQEEIDEFRANGGELEFY
jgi:hypothetical protein